MGPKRKRDNRGSVDGGDNRPSPHRPGNTALGRHDTRPDRPDMGGRRSSRGGGQGGRGRRESNQENNPNNQALSISSRIVSTPGPMSPPARPSSATQTPTSAVEPPTPVVRPDPEPFDYEFITDERVAAWNTGGRQEVIDLGYVARDSEDPLLKINLSTIFQELARAALDGRLDASEAGSCVKDIIGPDTVNEGDTEHAIDAQDTFVDTLSMIADAEPGANDPKSKTFPADLRTFSVATGISPIILRHKLDGALLQHLGLTRDTFIRVGIRQATHLLYRQANYNLIREETEGYSKLIVELFTVAESTKSANGGKPTTDVVMETFEKVKGLIGTFDLDVGRVLDVTIDVFASMLIRHFVFFVKFLRLSSWWPRNSENDGAADCSGLPRWALPSHFGPELSDDDKEIGKQHRFIRDKEFWIRAREVGIDAYFELGGREVVDSESRKILNEKSDDTEVSLDRQWIEATGTRPPSGNRTAAQLFGFKLRFYASPARDKEDVLPPNLVYTMALMIKVGFISLRDLYPHLWPLDEDMEKVRETRRKYHEEKERLSRPGGTANALTMSAPLPDDTLPNSGRGRDQPTTKTDTTTTPEIAQDKEDEPLNQKVELLIHLLTIGAIPESLFILGRFPWLPEAFPELLNLIHRILRHSIQGLYDTCRPTSTDYVPTTTREVASEDQGGMPKGQVRLSSIPHRPLKRWPFPDKHDTNEGHSYRYYWDEWADDVPVCQTVDDLFILCSTLLNISGVNIGRDSTLLSKLARIGTMSLSTDNSQSNLDRWQDLLKRLLVPALSITSSNPSVVGEVYELLRFYPVNIRYAIYAEWFEGQTSRIPAIKAAFDRTRLETLGIMKRISMTNLKAMAKSLSKVAFTSPGIVFNIALSQIESYTNLTKVVVECAKHFTYLGYDVLVWSLMSSLGAKGRTRTSAENQLLASPWLKSLSAFSGEIFKRYSNMSLLPIIQYVNNQLYQGNAGDLLVLEDLITQMSGIVPDTDFNDLQLGAMTGGPLLKRVALTNLQDKRFESEKTSKRLMRALTESKLAGPILISIAQYRQATIYKIPDNEANTKILSTGIDTTQQRLFLYLDLLRSNLSVEDFDKHVPYIPELLTDYGLDPTLAFMIGRVSFAHRMSDYTRSRPATPKSLEDEASETSKPTSSITKDILPSHEVLEPLIAAVKASQPESTWINLSPEFYVTFWTTSLTELASPGPSYSYEAERLTKEYLRVGGVAGAKMKEAKDNLVKEAGKQAMVSRKARARISARNSQWFDSSRKPDAISDALLQKCILPRAVFSPTDADFCFKMIRFLHENAPNFRTLSLYTKLFRTNRLRSIIFACSNREAENFGRFLRLILEDLARWHADSEVYQKEAWGSPDKPRLHGFAKSVGPDGIPKAMLEHDASPESTADGKPALGFKSILLMWHKALNGAIRDCLGGTDFMHIKNAIGVLKNVLDVFPVVNFMGNGFITQLEAIAEREKKREDLSLPANAVLVQLKKRMPKWIIVQDFGSNIGAQTNSSQLKPSTSSSIPAPRTELKPTAPEFKPRSRASSAGVSTPKPSTTEVEDGEVDDTKSTSVKINVVPGKESTPIPSVPEPKAPASSTAPSEQAPKSEILARREQHLREREKQAGASNSRMDSRHQPSSMTDRSNSNLPSRPDVPLPPPHRAGHQLPDRHVSSRHPDRRDIRDPRAPEQNRLDRAGDRARDFPATDRRAVEPDPRDFPRVPERGTGRDRIRDPPPQWTKESSQRNQEKQRVNDIRAESSGRLSRDPMPPPRASGSTTDRGPPVNPERVELINPERAALITGVIDPPRSDSPRSFRDDSRDRNSSRTQSPRRHGSERDHGRDDRSNRNGPGEPFSSRNRPDDVLPPPAGPRIDRPTDHNIDRNAPMDRSRESASFQPTGVQPRPLDSDHGRLISNGRQPDPNFGRLNPSSPSDIPSGPRDRNQRGNRMASSQHPQRMAEIPRPPTPTEIPTGPSSTRHGQSHSRRAPSGQFDSTPATPTAPATSLVPPPATIHASRLALLGQNAPVAPPLAAIQSDRIDAFRNDVRPPPQPPVNQTINNRTRPSMPSVVTSGPPSGPKGAQSSPLSSGPNGFTAPTGPSSSSERLPRGQGRRQLAGINNMLQQAGQQNGSDNVKIRGRGARMGSSMYGESPVSAPTTPIIPPPPPPGPLPPRIENNRPMINPERADLITGIPSLPDDRERERSNRRGHGSGRHSRRTSKSPGPDRSRDSNRPPVEDGYPSRDHSHRRDSTRGDPAERDRHPSRDPSRDLIAGRDVGIGGSVRGDRERDRDHRDGSRHGRERDVPRDVPRDDAGYPGSDRGDRTGERGGRHRGEPRGDDRRESRGTREDGGRKRHSENEGGLDKGREKRRRNH